METTDGCNGDGEDKLVAIEVERVAYAAIGRHLRVMCFLCLLLLVLGFLIGHHVANQHARELARDLEGRESGLREQLSLLSGEITSLRQMTSDSERRSVELRAQVARNEAAASELREQVASAEGLRRSIVVEAIEQAEADRRGLLREFKPYIERNQTLPADIVSSAFTRVIDAQRERLNRLIDVPSRPVCPGESVASLPLVPVSESGPSPTFSGSANSAAPDAPLAASTEILLFDTRTEGVAPAPPPPPETPIKPVQALAPPAGLTPLPAGPAVSLGPTVPPIPIVPAPPPPQDTTNPSAVLTAESPAAAAPGPAVADQVQTTTDDPALQSGPAATSAAESEPRKNRSALFFTPSRKPTSSSVPAIPIVSPASAPAVGSAPLPLNRAGAPR